MAQAVIKGGKKFEAEINRILKAVSKPGALRVGFLSGAKYPDGTSVAMVAAIQNFGAPSRNIPPRPFFSNMVREKQKEWGPALAKLLKQHNYDTHKALNILGEGIAGQLRQSIINTNRPALAPATIARKGSAKPLVDSGLMLRSISYEVK